MAEIGQVSAEDSAANTERQGCRRGPKGIAKNTLPVTAES